MSSPLPLISIVMPSLNQADFIPLAVESVLAQDYANLELIVMDGGSTDGTLAWLAAKGDEDHRLRWFSGADTGPANALNKALGLVRGTIVGWLNSDDLYTPGAVARAMASLLEHPEWIMVYGHGRHINEDGSPLDAYPTLPAETPLDKFADGCFICQPTVFFRRSMFVLLGNLDENLQTAFDFDYWLRAFKSFPGRIGFIDAVQAESRLHSSCITLRMRRIAMLEGMKVVSRYLGAAPGHWVLTYVEELLSKKAVIDPGIILREHLEAVFEEAAGFMGERDSSHIKNLILNDRRIDRYDWMDPAENRTLSMKEYKSGTTVVKSTPTMITLETTSQCNLRCVMCPHAINSVQRPKHLEEELVNQLDRYIRQASSIQLHGIGEPLISPAFWKTLHMLPPANLCESSINTNLTVLSDNNLEEILNSNLKIINVSLDAARPETYYKIRGADFNTVIENIQRIIEGREKKQSPYPMIYLNMTLMKSNIEEVLEFIDLGVKIKADKIFFWHLNKWSDEEMARYKVKRNDWLFDYAKEGLWNYPELSNHYLRQAEEKAKNLGIHLWLDHNKPVYF